MYMKRLFTIMVAAICLASCGGDGDDAPKPAEQKAAYNRQAIIGKWVNRYSAPEGTNDFKEVADHDTLQFFTDGTYRWAYEKSAISGTGNYSVDDTYLKAGAMVYDISFGDGFMQLNENGFGSYDKAYRYYRTE